MNELLAEKEANQKQMNELKTEIDCLKQLQELSLAAQTKICRDEAANELKNHKERVLN